MLNAMQQEAKMRGLKYRLPYELPVVKKPTVRRVPTKKGASLPAPDMKRTPKNIKLAPIKSKVIN